MERKTCGMYIIEKHVKDFYTNYTKYKKCNNKRELKRYYEKKYKLLNQQKKLLSKKEKKLL